RPTRPGPRVLSDPRDLPAGFDTPSHTKVRRLRRGGEVTGGTPREWSSAARIPHPPRRGRWDRLGRLQPGGHAMAGFGTTRRALVRGGGLLPLLPALLGGGTAWAAPAAKPARPAAPPPPGLRPGPEVYESIGVKPFVNARGTYTIITGSTALPEV